MQVTPESTTPTEAELPADRRSWLTPDFSQIDLASARGGGNTLPDSTAG